MDITGVNFDIIKNLITKYGVEVDVTPVTKTISNIEGDESLNEGSSYKETVYLSRRSTDWTMDEAGLIKGGDAIMLVNDDSLISKDYKIKHNNYTYRVHMVIDRAQAGGRVMFKTANLFLIDDE